MKQRFIYGFIAFFIFLPFALIGGGPFAYFLLALAIVALYELMTMAKITTKFPFFIGTIALLTQIIPAQFLPEAIDVFNRDTLFYLCAIILLIYTVFKPHRFNFSQAAIIFLGSFYVGYGFKTFWMIREISLTTLVYFLLVVWMTDIFALLIGKQIGKRPLAPQVSPKKTVEGMIGGTVSAVIITSIFLYFFDTGLGGPLHMTLLTIVLSLTGQFGDLVESAYKRHFGVKDSGHLIPAHGGILDRLDSVIFSSIVIGIWFNLFK